MQRFGSNDVRFSLGCRCFSEPDAANAAAAVTPAGQLDVTFEWLSQCLIGLRMATERNMSHSELSLCLR